MEKTYRFRQEDIAESVPLANSQQVCLYPYISLGSMRECAGIMDNISLLPQYFDLKLDTFGPYSIDYSRHGR